MSFTLPPLPFAAGALAARGMCQETLELHHGKHHAAYVPRRLQWPSAWRRTRNTEGEVTRRADSHVLWPGGSASRYSAMPASIGITQRVLRSRCRPPGAAFPGVLEKKLIEDFGSVDKFKETFKTTAVGQFGFRLGVAGGGARGGKLKITKTPNAGARRWRPVKARCCWSWMCGSMPITSISAIAVPTSPTISSTSWRTTKKRCGEAAEELITGHPFPGCGGRRGSARLHSVTCLPSVGIPIATSSRLQRCAYESRPAVAANATMRQCLAGKRRWFAGGSDDVDCEYRGQFCLESSAHRFKCIVQSAGRRAQGCERQRQFWRRRQSDARHRLDAPESGAARQRQYHRCDNYRRFRRGAVGNRRCEVGSGSAEFHGESDSGPASGGCSSQSWPAWRTWAHVDTAAVAVAGNRWWCGHWHRRQHGSARKHRRARAGQSADFISKPDAGPVVRRRSRGTGEPSQTGVLPVCRVFCRRC